MSSANRSASASRVGMVTQIAGVLLLATSIGLPYWKVSQAAGGNIFSGLWTTCSSSPLYNTDVFCTDSLNFEKPGWLKAIRALEVMGLALEVASLVLILSYVLGCTSKRNLTICIICCFLAGMFIIVGSAMYGNTNNYLHPGKPTWGYYLSYLGAIFSVIAGTVFTFEHINNQREYQTLP